MKFIRKAIKFLIKNKEYYKNAIIPLFIYTLEILTGGISVLIIFASRKYVVSFLILPQLITVGGGVTGIYSAHISTGLNTGEIKISFRNNTEAFYSLIFSALILALIFRLIIAIFWSIIFMKIDVFFVLLFIVLFSYVLNIFLSILLISWISFATKKRKLDPDLVLYPLSSVMNDFIVAASLYFTIILVESSDVDTIKIETMFLVVFLLIILFEIYKRLNINLSLSLKVAGESLVSITVGLIFSTINSSIFSTSINKLKQEPSILALWPILTTAVGGQASGIACFCTTRLHTGYIRTSREFFEKFGPTLLFSYFLSLISAGILYAITASIVSYSSEKMTLILELTLLTLLTSFAIMLILAVCVSSITFSFGIDPDSFAIPLVTSFSDFLVTFTLINYAAFLL